MQTGTKHHVIGNHQGININVLKYILRISMQLVTYIIL